MRQNYIGFPWRLQDLKDVCNALVNDIFSDFETFVAFHEDKGITDVVVRYVIDENKFGYTEMGNFFFLDDCMYVISDEEIFKDIHNEDMKLDAVEARNMSQEYFSLVSGLPSKINMGIGYTPEIWYALMMRS